MRAKGNISSPSLFFFFQRGGKEVDSEGKYRGWRGACVGRDTRRWQVYLGRDCRCLRCCVVKNSFMVCKRRGEVGGQKCTIRQKVLSGLRVGQTGQSRPNKTKQAAAEAVIGREVVTEKKAELKGK